ncbi:MAG: hypothetical protein K6F55_06580 [Eubacterium sp.]|nr:hypothetical protein [Eubacterium sp.]
MNNSLGKLVYFNSCKSAGKFNQFVWSISGSVLHVFQGERELSENSFVYQRISSALREAGRA